MKRLFPKVGAGRYIERRDMSDERGVVARIAFTQATLHGEHFTRESPLRARNWYRTPVAAF